MFKTIVVPLDGSARAERALPLAARLARTFQGSLVLVQVVLPIPQMAWYTPEIMDDLYKDTEDYLKRVMQSYDLSGIPAKMEIYTGQPGDVIISAAEKHQADLIVMCSHGHTGLKRWVLGSVAQKVVHYSPVPVLVIREQEEKEQKLAEKKSFRIMVALDGSPLAETTIAPAAYLSSALSAPEPGAIQLTRIIHLSSSFEYGQEDNLTKAVRQETTIVETYLRTIEKQIREGDLGKLNLNITTCIVHDLDVAGTLIRIAEQGEFPEHQKTCDAIALATHGRGGVQRWVMGSVAERMVGTTHLPLLIVRPPKEAFEKETQKTTEKATQPAVGLL